MECNVARVVDSFPDYLRAETITDRGQLRPRFMPQAPSLVQVRNGSQC